MTQTIKKIVETKITKRYTHDNMRLDAKMSSGASMRFSAGRSGEKLELAFSNDRAVLNQQTKDMMAWLQPKADENYQQVFDRLEAVLRNCVSGAAVMQAIKIV